MIKYKAILFFKLTLLSVLMATNLLFCKPVSVREQKKRRAKEAFVEKIIKNISFHGYFLSLKVKLGQYQGRAVVNNADLYRILKQDRRFDLEGYKSYIKDILEKDSTLYLRESVMTNNNVFAVHRKAKLPSDLSRSKDKFLLDFTILDGRALRKDLPHSEKVNIIDLLFKHNVAVKTDDESGLYLIDW